MPHGGIGLLRPLRAACQLPAAWHGAAVRIAPPGRARPADRRCRHSARDPSGGWRLAAGLGGALRTGRPARGQRTVRAPCAGGGRRLPRAGAGGARTHWPRDRPDPLLFCRDRAAMSWGGGPSASQSVGSCETAAPACFPFGSGRAPSPSCSAGRQAGQPSQPSQPASQPSSRPAGPSRPQRAERRAQNATGRRMMKAFNMQRV